MSEKFRPSPEQSDELSDKGKSRRSFLKKAGLAAGFLLGEEVLRRNLFSGGSDANANSNRRDRNSNRPEKREADIERLKDIKEFKDLGDGVLIICADTGDDDEYGSVIETLRERSQKRVENMKFQVHVNEDGTATAEIPTRKHEDKGLQPGEYPSGVNKIKITVVKQHNPALNGLSKNFGFIQLRGHTQHMSALLEKFKEHRKDKAILSMGGCESVQFMDENYTKETPIIADRMGTPAFTKHNTYMLITTLDRLDTSDSWDELQNEVSKISSRFRDQTIMPGNPDYYKYVAGEKR